MLFNFAKLNHLFKNVLFEEYFISVLKMLHKAVRFLRSSKVLIIEDILIKLPKFGFVWTLGQCAAVPVSFIQIQRAAVEE